MAMRTKRSELRALTIETLQKCVDESRRLIDRASVYEFTPGGSAEYIAADLEDMIGTLDKLLNTMDSVGIGAAKPPAKAKPKAKPKAKAAPKAKRRAVAAA